jgi:hypothetical protein
MKFSNFDASISIWVCTYSSTDRPVNFQAGWFHAMAMLGMGVSFQSPKELHLEYKCIVGFAQLQ